MMNLGQFEERYFRHQDGGYYMLLGYAVSATDQSLQVVYRHVWPFDNTVDFVRPHSEWVTNFVVVNTKEVDDAVTSQEPGKDRTTLQQEITQRKAERRAKQNVPPGTIVHVPQVVTTTRPLFDPMKTFTSQAVPEPTQNGPSNFALNQLDSPLK